MDNHHHPPNSTTTSSAPRDFNISISPDEPLSTLHSKIEQVSGLTAQQQRLIYRGRLISGGGPSNDESSPTLSSSSSSKSLLTTPIRSIDGLEDGHTIHLVPRPTVISPPANGNDTAAAATAFTINRGGGDGGSAAENDGPRIITGNGAGLLGALFNLGQQDVDSDNEQRGGNANNNNNNNNTDGSSPSSSMDPLESLMFFPRTTTTTTGRSNTTNRRRSRPNSYRRLVTDPRYPDPCPLEPIRQGLMTLHTMIQSQPEMVRKSGGEEEDGDGGIVSPMDANRKWFSGQWLDVRDTVNQWLEATIVEIVTPEDILVRAVKRGRDVTTFNRTTVLEDPVIGANDLEGRLRLLLEPATDENDRTLADLNNDDDLVGLVERKNNDNVQLLLIHYNGWPHRWDEWIRSDSERIRPFRTRSRHAPTSNHFCPSTESTFHSAPCTHIQSANEEIDRLAMIPELYRIFKDMEKIFESAIQGGKAQKKSVKGGSSSKDDARPLSPKEQTDLTVAMQTLDPDIVEEVMTIVQGSNEGGKNMDPADIDISALDCETQWKLKKLLEETDFERQEDYHLVGDSQLPWNTKRREKEETDIDSSEHDQNEERDSTSDSSTQLSFDKRNLEALGPLMDRLGRVLIDAAPHVSKVAESLSLQETNDQVDGVQDENVDITADSQPPSLRPSWSNAHATPLFDESEVDALSNRALHAANPDLVDYVHGFINHRNDGSSSRRNGRRNRSDGGLGSSILSAYLASLIAGVDGANGSRNGPRVVRIGGNDNDDISGPGLDIHIHAIVSGPGGPFMPDFLNNLGGATAQITDNDRNLNMESINQRLAEEHTETFQNLYSEESPAQNTSSEFTPNEDVEIEDESDTDSHSTGNSDLSEAARMPLLETNSSIASHEETAVHDEASSKETGDDQPSSESDVLTSDMPTEANDGNQVTRVSTDIFHASDEETNNTMSLDCKENDENSQGDDSSKVAYEPSEDHEINQAMNSNNQAIPNTRTPNRMSIDGVENDGNRYDASDQDDGSIHTAYESYESLEEHEVTEGISDNIDSEMSSASPSVDIKSCIVDSKDGENLEVCLEKDDGLGNSVVMEKESKQKSERPCESMECEEVRRCPSSSTGVASILLHDSNNNGDSSEHEQSSDVAKAPKSLFSRLLRRKQ